MEPWVEGDRDSRAKTEICEGRMSSQIAPQTLEPTIGALIIRIGFWGPLYYKYNKEPPKYIGNYVGPYMTP